MKKFIFIKTQFEGFHKYENAPDEVSFLKNLHRHIFYVKVSIQVFHNERDLEFFIVKKAIEKFIKESKISMNASCEYIAEGIYNFIYNNYGNERKISVEVSEDNENGAIAGDIL